ncbi:unnamed protein product [Ectocarpus sp. 12 AP-2014]
MRCLSAVAALLLACVAPEATSHSGHDHDESSHAEEEHFEVSAVYDVEAGTNSFIAIPAEGSFEQDTLAFMVVLAASADTDGLAGAEEDAEAAWDAYTSGAEDATVLAPGEPATPSTVVVYQVALEDPLVLVQVEVTIAGAYAVFLEHGAEEVGTVLASPSGVVLVAAAEEGGDENGDEEESGSASGTQWVNGLVASFVVSACSFAGLLVVANKRVAYSIGLSHAFIFASGALLTAALLHIIPEAMEGLDSSYDNLHDLGLYAGLTVLGGLSVSIVIHGLMESGHSHFPNAGPSHGGGAETVRPGGGNGHHARVSDNAGTMMPLGLSEGDKVSAWPGGNSPQAVQIQADVTQPPSPAESSTDNLRALIAEREGRSLLDVKGLQPVCWNVVIGDLVHNFADGVTIGAAFLTCSATIGWTVTASAALHELPHEIADFMALLNGGMSLKQAFAYNFLSALSAVLGTIIILALGDTLSDRDVSIVLLLGSGSFIFIALSELLPEALAVTHAVSEKGAVAMMCSQLLKLGSFLLGAILTGIPLLFDQHCDAAHEGHDH